MSLHEYDSSPVAAGRMHLGGVVRAQSDTTCRMPSNFVIFIIIIMGGA